MKAEKLKTLCEYLCSFEGEDFEIVVNVFGDMFILDYFKELDPKRMEELGCNYSHRHYGYTLED